jgi:hypothetical protein
MVAIQDMEMGVVINIPETKMVDEAVVVEWGLNMATAPTMDIEGAAISFQEVNTVLVAPTTIGEPVAMKVAAAAVIQKINI